MSANVVPVKVVKVLDPRLNINTERDYVVLEGSMVNSFQTFLAPNVSSGGVQITATPANRNIAVSRYVTKTFTFSGTINGTNTSGGPLLNENYYGVRQYPLASITSSETIQINNDTISQSPIYAYWPALLKYHNNHCDRASMDSITATKFDQDQEYWQTAQTPRNPICTFNQDQYECGRGSYWGLSLGANPNGGTAVPFKLTVTEPIMLSPLVFHRQANFTPALIGLQNFNYSCTFNNNLSRLLSIQSDQGTGVNGVGGSINITSVDVQITSASLNFEYFTPNPLMPLPSSLVSPYFSVVQYPFSDNISYAPGAEITANFSSIQVTSIPSKVYFFCREQDSNLSATSSDCYFGLPTVSNGTTPTQQYPLTITWNNNVFMSQATTSQIYNICIRNGLSSDISYTQWTKKMGSVICLQFGQDIGLMADEAPGCLGQYQLSATCRFVNINPTRSITPTVFMVVVYGGSFSIVQGNCLHQIGVLSRADVVHSVVNKDVTYAGSQDVYGGALFDTLKKGFQKVNKILHDSKAISNLIKSSPLPYSDIVSNVAKSAGYGRVIGGNLNKTLSRAELRDRLMEE